MGKFNRQYRQYFSYFSRKWDLTLHANCLLRRQFAWSVKSHFLGKVRKKPKSRPLNFLPSMQGVHNYHYLFIFIRNFLNIINTYHAMGKFNRQYRQYFSYFSRKWDLTLHANCLLRRQFAWSVESHFLVKVRKKPKSRPLKILPSMQSVNNHHYLFILMSMLFTSLFVTLKVLSKNVADDILNFLKYFSEKIRRHFMWIIC